MCVYLFVNITSLISIFEVFLSGDGENPFFLSARAQREFRWHAHAYLLPNNGGSNILKHENSKLWRDFFPCCAPVSLVRQRILIESFESFENYVQSWTKMLEHRAPKSMFYSDFSWQH